MLRNAKNTHMYLPMKVTYTLQHKRRGGKPSRSRAPTDAGYDDAAAPGGGTGVAAEPLDAEAEVDGWGPFAS